MRKIEINKKTKDSIFIYGLLLWPILHFFLFWVGMNARTAVDSFFTVNYSGGIHYVPAGFKNYMEVFQIIFGRKNADCTSIVNYKAVLNSLSLIPVAVFINMPITILFAYGIFKKIVGYRAFRIILFLPAIISSVVLCLCFKLAIDPNKGIIVNFLRIIGLGGDGTAGNQGIIPVGGWLGNNDTKWNSILVFSVFSGVSGNLIYFTSTMARLPSSVFESAELDGASKVKQLFSIVVPMIWPTITTMTVTLVAAVFGWLMPSLLLTGEDGMTTTIGLMITQTVKADKSNTVMSAFGVVVAILGTIIILTVKTLLEKCFEGVEY